jgi:hypothetical protein
MMKKKLIREKCDGYVLEINQGYIQNVFLVAKIEE